VVKKFLALYVLFSLEHVMELVDLEVRFEWGYNIRVDLVCAVSMSVGLN
jgi:hypothetical protein